MATAAEDVQVDDKNTITEKRVQVLTRLGLEHTTVYTEMQMLETYMEALRKRALNSYLRGHTRQTIQILLRHSMAQSLQDVYEKYTFYKRFQIVRLAKKIVPELYDSDRAFRQDVLEVTTQCKI